MNHISRLYDTRTAAERVAQDLENAGIPSDDVSVVAGRSDNPDDTSDAAEGASSGAGLGAAVGGGAGLLAGLGMLAIPGLGPVVAAGWLAATLTGAAAGAVTGAAAGGLIGALTDSGLDERDANVYAESLRRGGALVVVRTSEANRPAAQAVLDRHSSVSVSDRRSIYESEGWTKYDDDRGPYVRSDRAKTHGSSPGTM